MKSVRRRVASCAVAVVAATGCVGPARTTESYRLKAKGTLTTVASAVGTGRVVTRLASTRRAFPPYLSVLVGDAEREATGAETAFDSIQPPNATADRLRERVDRTVSAAVEEIVQVRIAVRRNQLAIAGAHADELARLARQLDAFSEALA